MDDGVLFAALGAALGLSALTLAAVKLRPARGSPLPLTGATARGEAWLLDPDRADPAVTRWRLRVAVPCPVGRLVAERASEPAGAWREAASRFGPRPAEAPPAAASVAGWRIHAERPPAPEVLTAIAALPAGATVVWDRELQVFAALPPDDAGVPELVARGGDLADAATPPNGAHP